MLKLAQVLLCFLLVPAVLAHVPANNDVGLIPYTQVRDRRCGESREGAKSGAV